MLTLGPGDHTVFIIAIMAASFLEQAWFEIGPLLLKGIKAQLAVMLKAS